MISSTGFVSVFRHAWGSFCPVLSCVTTRLIGLGSAVQSSMSTTSWITLLMSGDWYSSASSLKN